MATTQKLSPQELKLLATNYAAFHMRRDSGIEAVNYLPEVPDNGAVQQIRLIEVNSMLDDSSTESMEPFYFGIDVGTPNEHWLYTLDVTPTQWQKLLNGELSLPEGWSLKNRVECKPGNRGEKVA